MKATGNVSVVIYDSLAEMLLWLFVRLIMSALACLMSLHIL